MLASDSASCPALSLTLPLDAARWQGLISSDIGIKLGSRTIWLPAWFTTSGVRMPSGVARGTARAAFHFVWGMSLLLAVLSAVALGGLFVDELLLSALAVVGLVIFLATVIHEAGHVLMYRLMVGADAPAIAVVSGASCRVVRLRGTPSEDIAVALAGPLAPLVVAALIMPLWHLAPALIGIVLLVAVGHALSPLFPAGDGASIRDAARIARARRARGRPGADDPAAR